MIQLPNHLKQEFISILNGSISIEDFEKWVYYNDALKSVLSKEDFHELISFDYKQKDSKYELEKLFFEKYISSADYEKTKLLKLLYDALKKDEKQPKILRELHRMYEKGYYFLEDLGLGYGLAIDVPQTKYSSDSWDELSKAEQNDLLNSFTDRIVADIKRAINWIEASKIVLTGEKNDMGQLIFIDKRTKKEKRSM